MMKNFTQLSKKSLILPLFFLMTVCSVRAADTTPPVIILNTNDTLHVQLGSIYTTTQPTITDNQSDVNNIVVKKTVGFNGVVNTLMRGWYHEIYEATDSNGNKSTKTRVIKVDDFILPVITLHTADTVYHQVNTPYIPVSPSVTDNYYPNNQVSLVKLSGSVNVNVVGIYKEVYEAVDGSGNKTQVTRVVIVGDFKTSVYGKIKLVPKIYPNPSNSGFNLNLPEGHVKIGIRIVSIDGRVVYENLAMDPGNMVETTAFVSGAYTVLLNDGQKVSALRLLVQH